MIWLIVQMWILLFTAFSIGIYVGYRAKRPEKIMVVAERQDTSLGTLENDALNG